MIERNFMFSPFMQKSSKFMVIWHMTMHQMEKFVGSFTKFMTFFVTRLLLVLPKILRRDGQTIKAVAIGKNLTEQDYVNILWMGVLMTQAPKKPI